MLYLLGITCLVCHLSNANVIQLSHEAEKTFYDVNYAEEIFRDFVDTHGKHYEDETEYNHRLQIFIENLHEINRLNNASTNTIFGITHLHDMSAEEFKQYANCLDSTSTIYEEAIYAGYLIDDAVIAPEEFDWTKLGMVTPVKNQHQCFSCWAFAAVGVIESQYAIKHRGVLETFSEQQMIDCNRINGGCQRGWTPAYAFEYVKRQGGLMSERDYPYINQDEQCHFDRRLVEVRVANENSVLVDDEEQLKNLLYQHGPIAVGVDSSNWHHYAGGILTYGGNKHDIDHAVLLVGYGNDNGQPYWIIKNSWGTGWGIKGYILIPRGYQAYGIGMQVTMAEIV